MEHIFYKVSWPNSHLGSRILVLYIRYVLGKLCRLYVFDNSSTFFSFLMHILEFILNVAFNRRIQGKGCWVCTLYILDKQVVKQQHDVLFLSKM